MTRIACCQIAPTIADLASNSALIEAQIATAVAAGADVIVLPELVTSGYMLADTDEARSVALTPASPEFEKWAVAAGDAVGGGGFCELGDDVLFYNSAVAVTADGVIGHYRKTHLWDREKLLFTPGDALPPVIK